MRIRLSGGHCEGRTQHWTPKRFRLLRLRAVHGPSAGFRLWVYLWNAFHLDLYIDRRKRTW